MKNFLSLILALFMLSSTLVGCDTSIETKKESDQKLGATNNSLSEDKKNNIDDVDDKVTNSTESALNTEIISSVLSSLGRVFKADDAYASYNFIDDQTGFFFFLGGYENRLLLFMKTFDGGNNWYIQTVINGPSTNSWKERIICAKMVNEKVGLISAKYYADDGDRFSHRTYITTDGGENWDKLDLPSMGVFIGLYEAYDLIYENGQYVIWLREANHSPYFHYKYLQYSSPDLKTWTIVEQ